MEIFQRVKQSAWLAVCIAIAQSAGFCADATDWLVYSTGPLILRPHVAVMEQYNDNIYFRDKNIESDLLTMVSPGLNLQLGKDEGNYLRLDYEYDQLLYLDHPKEDSPEHRITLSGRYEKSKIHVTTTDSVMFLSGILGGGNNLGQRVNRLQQGFNIRTQYDIGGKTGVYLEGRYDSTDFDQGVPLYDSTDFSQTFGFAHKTFAKVSLFGEVYGGFSENESNHPFLPPTPSSKFYGGFIGARGELRPRTTAALKFGYQTRSFDDNSTGDSSPVVDMSLTQKIGERTQLMFSYRRQSLVSIQYFRQAYSLDGVNLQATRLIGSNGKWSLGSSLEFDSYEYERTPFTAARNDIFFRGNVSLNYKIQKWLLSSLTFETESFSSNAQGVIDYLANRVTLKLLVGY